MSFFEKIVMGISIVLIIFVLFLLGYVVYLGVDQEVDKYRANYHVSDGCNIYYIEEIISNDGDNYVMKTVDGDTLNITPVAIMDRRSK